MTLGAGAWLLAAWLTTPAPVDGGGAAPGPAPQSVEAPSAPRDAGEAAWRRELDDILARREFRARPRGSDLDPRLPELPFWTWLRDHIERAWERLLDWLRGQRRRQVGRPGEPLSASISEPAAWALAAGATALLALLLYRAWRRRRASSSSSSTTAVSALPSSAAMPDALSQPVDAWARFADEFARTGEWRLALRALYLRLLALLHERGAIRYERQRTNGDYVAALRGPAAEPFRRVTLSFDQAWYGNKPCERADYDAALAWTRAVDRATARAPESAPGGGA
jgi:hypothetical protein